MKLDTAKILFVLCLLALTGCVHLDLSSAADCDENSKTNFCDVVSAYGWDWGRSAQNLLDDTLQHSDGTVDERRKLYGAMQYANDKPVVQRWFLGVHKDVGGGYLEGECELSDVALDWMKRKAVRCGLLFKTPLPKRPRSYDFSSLRAVHNEETPLDPIRKRTFHEGQSIDRSVRDRVKTSPGYFPAIAEVPSLLLDWLKGLVSGRAIV